jgi:hypothetical protein
VTEQAKQATRKFCIQAFASFKSAAQGADIRPLETKGTFHRTEKQASKRHPRPQTTRSR